MSVLGKKYFRDEAAAVRHLEALAWPDGVVCPHCGTIGRARRQKIQTSPSRKNPEGVTRFVWRCSRKDCHKIFSVLIGTVFEWVHIPLHKVLQAVYLVTASSKEVSAYRLAKTLEIKHTSAGLLVRRIRAGMGDGALAPVPVPRRNTKYARQIDRFRASARALGCEESDSRFGEVLKRVARHTQPSPQAAAGRTATDRRLRSTAGRVSARV